MRKIEKIIWHCSDTPESMDIGAEEIRQWHLQRGWSDIGYHYVIRRDGKREIGRALEKPGAHVKGHNRYSIGCCLVGRGKYTDEQLAEAHYLTQELKTKFREATIHQHSDFDPKKPFCAGLEMSQFDYI